MPPSLPVSPPRCFIPSLPPVLIGALLRHHRKRTRLNLQKASAAVEVPASRIGAAERAQLPLPIAGVRALLDLYNTPDREAQQVLALMEQVGHQHWLDQITLPRTWVDALVAGCRSIHVYSASAEALARVTPPASPVAGGQCQMVLLLNENVLDQPADEEQATAFSHLVRLTESGAVTVHLVPDRLEAPAPLLAEYTYTRWGWDGSSADRMRRQIFAAYRYSGVCSSLSNGPVAAAERQALRQAVHSAQPSGWSLHLLRQAALFMQRSTSAEVRCAFPRSGTSAPAAPSVSRSA
ncbi:helix-turn-helix domain-containing protein [Streptomyces sp. NPDC007872]|uniref:helix-turn-helix domain-containing protein n=1 Tax=Streptomyces sp. NPDC007872 TaxID=3364782 RepID=UPI00369B0E8C